jgi:hypothetical protein
MSNSSQQSLLLFQFFWHWLMINFILQALSSFPSLMVNEDDFWKCQNAYHALVVSLKAFSILVKKLTSWHMGQPTTLACATKETAYTVQETSTLWYEQLGNSWKYCDWPMADSTCRIAFHVTSLMFLGFLAIFYITDSKIWSLGPKLHPTYSMASC